MGNKTAWGEEGGGGGGEEPCVIACDYVNGNIGQLLPLTIDQCIITPMKAPSADETSSMRVLSFPTSGEFPRSDRMIIDKGNTYVNYNCQIFTVTFIEDRWMYTDDAWFNIRTINWSMRDETSGHCFCSCARMETRKFGEFLVYRFSMIFVLSIAS